ncbi:MAG: eL32 family ribosomal protein [Nanoarchaeota archaeon]
MSSGTKSVRRKDSHKFGKLGMKVKAKRKWRKAKGRHNKIRESKRGHAGRPKIGYKADYYVKPITIENMTQLLTLGKEQQAVVSGRVGGKKRTIIMEKAKSLGLKVENPRRQKK